MANRLKEKQTTVRFSEEDLAKIQRAADLRHLQVAPLLRSVVMMKIEEILRNEDTHGKRED